MMKKEGRVHTLAGYIGICSVLLWMLRLAYGGALGQFVDNLFPPGDEWAGMLAAALAVLAATQLPTSCIRAAFAEDDTQGEPTWEPVGANCRDWFEDALWQHNTRENARRGLSGCKLRRAALDVGGAIVGFGMSLVLLQTRALSFGSVAAMWYLLAVIAGAAHVRPGPGEKRQERSALPIGLPGGERLKGQLEWRDVTVNKKMGDKPLLRRVSFRLAGGITVVLGDPMGLFGQVSTGRRPVDEGEIYYGVTPLGRLAPVELSGKVALLGACAPVDGVHTIAALLGPEEEKGRALARELGLHELILAAGGYQARPDRLSNGAIVLARLAAAMAGMPRLLILDHLLDRLDEDAAAGTIAIARRRGIDCVVVTSRENLPPEFDCLLELRGDTLLFQGTRHEFFAREEAEHAASIQ